MQSQVCYQLGVRHAVLSPGSRNAPLIISFARNKNIKKWIVPEDFDHADTESKYLMGRADVDGNELLSKQEVLDQYDVFVGSSATKYGDILSRHDEF